MTDPAAAPAPETAENKAESAARPEPQIDFTAFILSLASTALIQMGAAPDPDTQAVSKDLAVARQTVNVLGLLREKTRGNLTAEEQTFFDALLYDLRMRFLDAQKAG